MGLAERRWSLSIVEVRYWSIVEGRSLSIVEGRSLSIVEGRSLSIVEGRSLSIVEGRSLSIVEGRIALAQFTSEKRPVLTVPRTSYLVPRTKYLVLLHPRNHFLRITRSKHIIARHQHIGAGVDEFCGIGIIHAAIDFDEE